MRLNEFFGGEVLSVRRGLYSLVTTLDCKSMYLMIMIDLRVSPENCHFIRKSVPGRNVFDWNHEYVIADIDGAIVKFNRNSKTIVSEVQRDLVARKRGLPDSMKAYGDSLKVVANSAYGAMEYEESVYNSRRCTAMITLGGRWIITVCSVILKSCRLEVIYGDTDSCFVVTTDVRKSGFGLSNLIRPYKVIINVPACKLFYRQELTYEQAAVLYSAPRVRTESARTPQTPYGLCIVQASLCGLCKIMTIASSET